MPFVYFNSGVINRHQNTYYQIFKKLGVLSPRTSSLGTVVYTWKVTRPRAKCAGKSTSVLHEAGLALLSKEVYINLNFELGCIRSNSGLNHFFSLCQCVECWRWGRCVFRSLRCEGGGEEKEEEGRRRILHSNHVA